LVAVGRSANGNAINAAAAGVEVSARGLIDVDRQMRTNVTHIFAIGDIVGAPMLGAQSFPSGQGRGGGRGRAPKPRSMHAASLPLPIPILKLHGRVSPKPRRRERGIQYGKGVFPWAASGRSLALNRDDGFTKLLFDPETQPHSRRRHRWH